MNVPTVCASVAICLLMGFTATAEAAKSKKSKKSKTSDVVTVDGCAHVVLPFCVGVTSGNTTYIVNSAQPSIWPGMQVTVTGRKTGNVGPCFGTDLKVSSWEPKGVCVLR